MRESQTRTNVINLWEKPSPYVRFSARGTGCRVEKWNSSADLLGRTYLVTGGPQ